LEWLIERQMEIPIGRGPSVSNGAGRGMLGLPAYAQRDNHSRQFSRACANGNSGPAYPAAIHCHTQSGTADSD